MARALSFTQLSTFAKCPRRYYYAYEQGIRIPPAFVLTDGRCYHKAAEAGNLALLGGRALSAAGLAEHYHSALDVALATEESQATRHEVDSARDIAGPLLAEYHRTVYPHVRPVEGGVERRIDTVWQVNDTPISFCGVVDLVEVDGRIVDYKSVGRPHGADAVRGSAQLHLYAGHLGGLEVGHIQLVKSRHPRVERVDVTLSPAAIKNTRRWAEDQARAIVACRASGVWPQCDRESWTCRPDYCGFYGICYLSEV